MTQTQRSQLMKQKWLDPEYRASMSNAHKGYTFSDSQKINHQEAIPKGEQHFAWKEKPQYSTLHRWVRRWKGKASHCEHCELKEIPKGFKRYFGWANISREYKRDLSDWIQLCMKCHKSYDGYGV